MSPDGNYRSGAAFRSHPSAFVVPWPAILIPTDQESEADSMLLVCGTKLVVCDVNTGQAGDFNQGKPLELGFIPALTPKVVRSGTSSKAPIGVLLCNQVAITDPDTSTKPITRFSMWSLETAQEIWHYDAASDTGWTGIAPDWPLVKDLTGDGVPEILIADGADLENHVYSNATCLSSLQALDSRTGKPVWNNSDVAQIRNQDRQVQRVLIGPDADGDQRDDVYVVSPMRNQNSYGWIFIDILSATTGTLIRSTKSNVPVFERSNHIDLEPPSFLGVCADGHPRLVVATKRVDSNSDRKSVVLLSTGTGEMTQIGDQLENPLRADGDGDGNLDLFLIKPRSRSSLKETAQLISLKSSGGRGEKITASGFLRTDDVDGDGVRDLLSDFQRCNFQQALSGATGERLWLWEHQSRANGDTVKPLNKDIDGDNINDYLVARVDYESRRRNLSLTLVSGRGGRMLWQTALPTDAFGRKPEVKCADMNADGVNDIVLIHRFNANRMGTNASLRVSCIDGKSGTVHWHSDLAAASSPATRPSVQLDKYPLQIVDVDDDGLPDVFCRRFEDDGTVKTLALSGRSGKLLWQQDTADDGTQPTIELPAWRTKVLATGPGHQKQFVIATANEDRRKARWTVRVTFSDLESERPVSSWSDEGRFKQHLRFSGNLPGQWNGIPFEIAAGEKHYTGICIQDQAARKLQIVVLDSSQGKAVEVQRVEVPLPDDIGSGYAWVGQFLIADVNQDGRTDVISHDGSDLIAIDLVSKKEINRKSMPTDYRRLILVDPETSLIHMTTNTNQDLRLNRLKLIDLKTFDIVWDVHMPYGGGNIFEGLLSGDKPDNSNVKSATPRLLYKNGEGTMLSTASAAEYVDRDETLRQQISLAATKPTAFTAGRFNDPRMIEPLPWSSGNPPENLIAAVAQVVTNTLLIVLGAFVFPFFYVRYMMMRKRWSIKLFLLLPLLFIVPYLVLQLTLEVDGVRPAPETARQFGVPLWMGKLLVANFLALPALAFVATGIKHLWSGNWKRFIRLSIATIAIAIMMGGLMLLAHSYQFQVGNRYDWHDWSTLLLILYSSWLAGFVILIYWIFVSAGRLMFSLTKLILSRPKLATS